MSIVQTKIQQGNDNNNARPVYDIKSGNIYGSRLEASKELGLSGYKILKLIKSGELISI